MSAARSAGVVLLLAALLASWPAVARASDVSEAEFRSLAEAAVDDAGALVRLRAVDSVDGRAVDVEGALAGARGEALDARLRMLAEDVPTTSSSLDAQAQARDVLAEDRFQEGRLPGPFRGLIDWLEDRLNELDAPIEWLDDLLPGPRSVIWIVAALAIVAAGWLVARRTLTRRVRASARAAEFELAERDEDPRALDRRADAAEAAGDLEAALRLRFRAGLLRLDARGAISFRPSISTHEVRRALRSPEFDALAATFDDVVYGGRSAEPDDVTAARETWPVVVKEAA